ncbi:MULTISPECIES: hypothetical protein [unclassified Arthrobacter]|nr:hypothetical protein [Arthrobacter sp. MAHUQ-56]MBX7443355.1 hypothetical protein [Arthrobacter sp. MAHUQ-56]
MDFARYFVGLAVLLGSTFVLLLAAYFFYRFAFTRRRGPDVLVNSKPAE